MVGYNFDSILGQRVSFAPAVDTVRFEITQASQVSFSTLGATLLATASQGFAALDATPQYTGTNLGMFNLTNVHFANNSILAVGDLTLDDTLDGNANTLDFTTNVLLTSGLNANNQINGLGGNDTINISTGTGNNLIFGGLAADTITAGSGNNTIYGGSGYADSTDGADKITVGGGSNLIYGNGGADSVAFSAPTTIGNLLRFLGGAGGDTLTASLALGQFDLNGGTDSDLLQLTGATANNTLYGGLGTDTIDLSGSSGNNTVYGGAGVVDAADGGDAITLGGGSDLLYGNGGADSVTASPGVGKTATIFLGAGADVLNSTSSLGAYFVIAGTGGDKVDLTNHVGNATIYGGSGIVDTEDSGDTITASSGGNSLIYGNAGADVITVRPGISESATVYGGAGNDTINALPTSATSAVSLYGNTGNDVFALNFSSGAPSIAIHDYNSFADTDNLRVTLSGGGSAADLVVERNATLTTLSQVNAEHIVLDGFTGNFTSATFKVSDDSVLITNFGGTAATLTGTDHDDQLIAGGAGDTLIAGAGLDILTGGAGADRIFFFTANFTLADTVTGGAGLDTLVLGTPGTAVADEFFAHVSGVEILKLESGDFSTASVSVGTAASVSGIFAVDATSASKVTIDLSGSTHGILYRGGTGVDSIQGSNHNDAIDGINGDDTIVGNRGNDTLTGGAGNDTFAYRGGALDGIDTIRDFDFGEPTTTVDKLQFSPFSYILGNLDTVVDGAIISNSAVSAGASSTELVILKSVGIATDAITATLNTINADILPGHGVLDLFYDTTRQQAVLYFDSNGGAAGGQQHLITFENMTELADVNKVNFTDFSFV